MHSLSAAVYLAFYSFDIRVPDCIASSMRMAYIVTEMNALSTNITLSHIDTSSPFSKLITLIYYQKNIGKASKKILFYFFVFNISFFRESC
jgi:hypothetical protein